MSGETLSIAMRRSSSLWSLVLVGACTAPSGVGSDDAPASTANGSETTGGPADPAGGPGGSTDGSDGAAPPESTGSSGDESGSSPIEPDLPENVWLPGEAPNRVAGPDLHPLPGGLEGPPIWVSNNPEEFTGNGWLFQHARTDDGRGGESMPLSSFVAYVFHLNGTGSTRTVHLIATNPQATSATVTARGSLYRNDAAHPIGPGTGPSVAVATDFLNGTGNIDVRSREIAPGQGVELARITAPNASMLDGRLEIEATAGVYVYSVVTTSGTIADAINATQAGPATGLIVQPGPNEFGRMAGVYEHAQWRGTVWAEVPPAPAHVGLALNTNDKFALDGATLHDQSALASMHMSDSSDKSYGNYGIAYTLRLSICSDEPRTVRVAFGSNFTSDSDSPSFTWNGPVRVGEDIVPVYTRPTAPQQTLATLGLAGEGCQELDLEFVVPGLITGGQQLVLESL